MVPKHQWPTTPLLCLGTGGLRALNNEQRWSVLAATREILLQQAHEGGFKFVASWARVLTAQEEGVYAWLALNAVHGRLTTHAGAIHFGEMSLYNLHRCKCIALISFLTLAFTVPWGYRRVAEHLLRKTQIPPRGYCVNTGRAGPWGCFLAGGCAGGWS